MVLIATRSDPDADVATRVLHRLGFIVHRAKCYRDTVDQLVKHRFAIIMADPHLGDGSWKDILSLTAGIFDQPRLTLLADGVDAGLCAEALNLGVYDVLSRPLEEQEIWRVAQLAGGMMLGWQVRE